MASLRKNQDQKHPQEIHVGERPFGLEDPNALTPINILGRLLELEMAGEDRLVYALASRSQISLYN